MFKWRHMVLHNLINTGLVIGLLFEGTYLKQCYQIIHVIYWYSHMTGHQMWMNSKYFTKYVFVVDIFHRNPSTGLMIPILFTN